LRNPDLKTRIWAADSLGELGNTEGTPVLIDLLRNPKMRSSEGNIIEALQRVTGKNLGYNRVKWLEWWKSARKAD
jgi:hypothetical protein